MTSPTETRIRRALTNCSKGEATRMVLPAWVRDLDPDRLDDVRGWRDPKAPDRGVLLVPTDDGTAGVVLRAATGATRAAAMCALCRTTHTVGGVALFAAPRRGAKGRQGDTVGTYICADLACAEHVRVETATAALKPAPGTTVDERRAGLRERAAEFVAAVTAEG
ncbi:FBP domain-containing protein [Pseudonocardia alni]|uniref:Treble-clef zinc-finger protein n=1 Tax=Pseudonocardia alni TaxID=33907 RepID=A0AA44ZPP2_PSEA5|nr:FBP domain-containing protein [Pseudonocardia alni]PKB30865.1 treble-clef zinc-finger protein [Pseudonocardia alni]